jgi:putative intracellular protease/amidase
MNRFLTLLVLLTIMITCAANCVAQVQENTDSNQQKQPEKILMVVANPVQSPKTGWPVGFWAAELTHPYDELTHFGYSVVIASPAGGKVTPDAYSDPRHESGYSAHDFVSLGFLSSKLTAPLLDNTMPLKDINHADYSAILLVGGQSPMFTFREDKQLQQLVREFYESGRPTAALCHGVSGLVDVQLSNGEFLLKGKKVTGFSLAEDQFVENAAGGKQSDWYVEPAMRERGAQYSDGGMWADYAMVDGNLITGQQQNSGRTVARWIIEKLRNPQNARSGK